MQALVAVSLAVAVAGVVLNVASLLRFRGMVPHDLAMTVAMAVGMAVGLHTGIIAGVLGPTDMGGPTAVGVVAGVAAGVALGCWAGLMTLLEGSMSGLMGGAMGAMMGGMMPGRAGALLVSAMALTAITSALSVVLVIRSARGDHGGHRDHGEPFWGMGLGRSPVWMTEIRERPHPGARPDHSRTGVPICCPKGQPRGTDGPSCVCAPGRVRRSGVCSAAGGRLRGLL